MNIEDKAQEIAEAKMMKEKRQETRAESKSKFKESRSKSKKDKSLELEAKNAENLEQIVVLREQAALLR